MISEVIQSTSIPQWASAIVFALVGIAFGIQRLIKSWKETDASSNVISMLHTEVKRMGEHNNKLLIEITSLQTQVTHLNAEISNLSVENHKLKQQVADLTTEIEKILIK